MHPNGIDFVRRWVWLNTLVLAAAMLLSNRAVAATLWTENAENGLTNIISNADPSYPLIQSSVVGQGSNAFHLAQPLGLDNWFTLNRTVTIQSDTKLFFVSRLGYATPSQVGRVQISLDGGNTWPTTIFNQVGSGGAGEGAFSLKTLNLGTTYTNQNLRFRFYYDYSFVSPGNYFNQTSAGVGWYIDDIQIGSAYQKSQWSIGNPTDYEQQYLEYINRARVNAIAEATRLASETDSNVLSSYSSNGINTANILSQFTASVATGYVNQSSQPLSFNAALLGSAQLHTQDLFQHQLQQHPSSSSPPAPFAPGDNELQRAQKMGYTGTSVAENVYSHAKSVKEGHAAFDVDWGPDSKPTDPNFNPAFVGQGMQNPAGHRHNIHAAASKEIGIGVINGTNGTVGPQVVTQDFGTSAVTYITGVVFQDTSGNNFYDIGEGRSGVRIDVDGSAYYAISTASGGYSVPVSADGIYNVTFSGGGFATFSTTATILNGLNVKVDYRTGTATIAGDFNGNGTVDAADYVLWRKDPNHTQSQYDLWRSQFGKKAGGASGSGDLDEFNQTATATMQAVPEPGAQVLVLFAMAAMMCFCGRKY